MRNFGMFVHCQLILSLLKFHVKTTLMSHNVIVGHVIIYVQVSPRDFDHSELYIHFIVIFSVKNSSDILLI